LTSVAKPFRPSLSNASKNRRNQELRVGEPILQLTPAFTARRSAPSSEDRATVAQKFKNRAPAVFTPPVSRSPAFVFAPAKDAKPFFCYQIHEVSSPLPLYTGASHHHCW
jgi:hypothetical protein